MYLSNLKNHLKLAMMNNSNCLLKTCKENGQKLHMIKSSYIENSTFLYMTQNEIIK